jgi:4-methyl-5(b-hydroxyethyl)-thiazole monophosphate biosynthesis
MKKILLLLAKGFETYEASVFIDVIGWNYTDGDKSTKLFSCGLTKEVASTFDQKFIVDYLHYEIKINDFEALAIPGGFEEYGFYEDAYSDSFLQIIRDFNAQNKLIASICVGALPLGKSGILRGKRATTYNSQIRRNALKEFKAEIVNQPVVMEGNIITSSNPASAIDVAFLLLEQLTDKENANFIKRAMGFIDNGK